MSAINRRRFTGTALAGLGSSMLARSTSARERPGAKLPAVRWGKHALSRVLVGHNPLKGQSHFNPELNREMRDWFALENIKPSDVILLGMWQKYKDQVAENVGYVRKILGAEFPKHVPRGARDVSVRRLVPPVR